MKRYVTLFILLAMMLPAMAEATVTPVGTPRLIEIEDETLTYDVIYKWGFINKVAGYATMSLRSDGDNYLTSVHAKNAPWANSIYTLRDTLYSTITKAGLYPINYIYIAHEQGKYKKDVVKFNHSGNTFTADAIRYKRPAGGGEMTSSTIELEAQGMTVDMLSAFFYLRTLDFPSMSKGTSNTVNIFSGSKKELLTITYLGKQTIKNAAGKVPVYYINFTFTRQGKQSSAPISAWITADTRRIPLKIEGQLPVGKVHAVYTGSLQ